MSSLGDGARLAAGTLTVLPVPPPRAVGPRVARTAMVLAPLVVLPIAGAAAVVAWAGEAAGAPPLLTASLAVAVLAVGSGVLHLDGLADTADGLAVQGDRGRRLEVMRRGDIGPAGVVALVLVLLVQVSAFATVPEVSTLCLGVVASRATLAVACARGVPAARVEGLGNGVAGSVPPALAAVVVAVVAAVAGLVDGWRGVAGVSAALVAASGVLLAARRRFGGVTGDVLGACVELALAGYLVSQVVG
ncbi:MAG TPA: adenosylcobinamide-GDP ribazoletransferase [Nocardioides sp.]|nr:adenosylcobinamide-GDP ribazoletransferase [Nocardioides sp.]